MWDLLNHGFIVFHHFCMRIFNTVVLAEDSTLDILSKLFVKRAGGVYEPRDQSSGFDVMTRVSVRSSIVAKLQD